MLLECRLYGSTPGCVLGRRAGRLWDMGDDNLMGDEFSLLLECRNYKIGKIGNANSREMFSGRENV